ncbi:hypothetical protein QJS10_CPA05g01847 [Acorus calamus]|uniref:Reverse transcriptase domain-containing protein n=1 Tax=Acorus calamus TaxID=4465 RepID=A0AAV9EWZ8_ACOCL|nr:hypothetical protein QJS10_CPA05g01847 [Acorus calamus]
MDTKLHASQQDRVCRFICPDHLFHFSPEARLGLLWNPDSMNIRVTESTTQFLHFRVTPISGHLSPFMVTAIYASNSSAERLLLWQNLSRLSTQTEPWLLCGDFNEVRYAYEKVGGRPIHTRQVRRFNECIERCSLEDLKATGHILSWNNQQSTRISCRLDRALGNHVFFSEFPNSVVHYLAPGISDHSPLRISMHPLLPTGPRPFKYFEMWESHPTFDSIVHTAWNTHFEGSPLFIFTRKLSATKDALKRWNIRVYGPVLHQLQEKKRALIQTQLAVHQNQTNISLRSAESEAKIAYITALHQEESFLRQKSRQHWLALGDRNSKFFYSSIQSRKSRNSISTLKSNDGLLISDHSSIKRHIVEYYTALLNRESGIAIAEFNFPSKVTEEQNIVLTSTVTIEELRAAVFSQKPLSSPGPDGFPARFYQKYWDLINQDLLLAVQHFMINRHLLKQVSHSFITLIPKTANADSLDHFRPISLCNSLYKIITKVLASRLQQILSGLVSGHQTAFIKGRSIHHNILLAHELISYINKDGPYRACIKVDLRKAFDSVRWPYLIKVLQGPKTEGGLGVTRIEDWSRGSSGARFWELASNVPSMWASWIRLRYLRKCNIWNCRPPNGCSCAWKQIIKAREWVVTHTKYIIFQGLSINLWQDPWLNGSLHQAIGRTLLSWGPPDSTSVAVFIKEGEWCKPPRWPQDIDYLW